MTAATDKGGATAKLDIGVQTLQALGYSKNVVSQTTVLFPGETPDKHKYVSIVGTTVPDNTDYPDSLAPVGSEYKRLIVSGGVVTGSMNYVKTAAATWTAQS